MSVPSYLVISDSSLLFGEIMFSLTFYISFLDFSCLTLLTELLSSLHLKLTCLQVALRQELGLSCVKTSLETYFR